jgi:hypothetical protein
MSAEMDATAVTEEHLAEVTEETVMDLVEGANFIVECPECEAEWAMAVEPMALAALSNEYGNRAVENRFRKIARDIPAVTCGTCLFRGADR